MPDDLPRTSLKTGSKRNTNHVASYEEHSIDQSDDEINVKKQRIAPKVKPKQPRKSSRASSKSRASTKSTTGQYNLRSRNNSISESTIDSDSVSLNSRKSKALKEALITEAKSQPPTYSPFIVDQDHMLTMDRESVASSRTTSTTSNVPDHFHSLDVDNKKFVDGRSLWKSNYSQIFRRSENVQSISRQTYSKNASSYAEGDTMEKNNSLRKSSDHVESIKEKPTFSEVSKGSMSINYDASLGSQWAKTSTTPQGTRHTEIRVINCCPPGHHYLKDHKLTGSIWSYLILLQSYLLSVVKFPFIAIFRVLSFCINNLWRLRCLWILLPILLLPILYNGLSSDTAKSYAAYLQVPKGIDLLSPVSSFMALTPQPQSSESTAKEISQHSYKDLEKQILNISHILTTVLAELEESKQKEIYLPAELAEKTEDENANKIALLALQKELAMIKEKMSSLEQLQSMKKEECCSRDRISPKIQNIEGSDLAVDLDALFREKLAIFASDVIGMQDFALESAGGSIHCVRDTQTYSVDAPTYSFFGFPAIILKRSPYMVLDSKILPGECWPFVGDKGSIVIRLSEPIFITAVTIDHAPKILNENFIIDTAPKDFSVHVMKEADNEGIQILNGTYDKAQINYTFIQTFKVDDDKRPIYPIRYVEVKILSNHGNPNFTCIYRIRVHGNSAMAIEHN